MIGGLFKNKEARKFRYIPRFYDTKSHDLVNRRIGDTRFAERYIARRKSMEKTTTEEDFEQARVDYHSYRTKNRKENKIVNRNTFFIFAILMLFVFIMWMITNPKFGNFFAE